MWSDLPSALRDWLFTLGFDKQNLSDTEIEKEFLRLTAPEMRDIWRHMMIHVVSVQKKRYIQKVLLLHELKKQRSLKGVTHSSLPKNLSNVTDLETYKFYEKTLLQLDNRELLIRDRCAKIEELKRNHDKLNEERRCKIENLEAQNHILTLLRLKTKHYEKLNKDLLNTRKCLSYAGSNLWNSVNTNRKPEPTEDLMKNLIEKVHEFGTLRQSLDDKKLISEQQKLQEDIVRLTMNVMPSALQKNVISLLENTLGALLKLTEHVKMKSRETNNNVDFEWELPELKKQCIRTFVDNHDLKLKVKAQENRIRQQFSELVLHFEKHCEDENEKTVVKNWLDTEQLKQRMTSRLKFLSKMEKIASNEISSLSDTVFANAVERNTFFKRINDMNDQLVNLEKGINCNLSYLSDKSIDLFVHYQQLCRSKIEKFVQRETSSSYEHVFVELPDLLKTEIGLLENLDLFSVTRPHLKRVNHDTIPSTNVVEYTRRTNFLINLESACNDFFQRISYLDFSKGDKILKVKSSEDAFRILLSKLLKEAKDNLHLIEQEAETCSKNLKIWGNFSIDELIPEHMVVEKYTFSQWQEKYRACIRNLSK